MFSLFKNLFIFLTIIFFALIVQSEEAEKDCNYCIKYEKLLDWPLEDRPSIFVYQENINYPTGMFGQEGKMKAAGSKVAYRFVKKKKSLMSFLHILMAVQVSLLMVYLVHKERYYLILQV